MKTIKVAAILGFAVVAALSVSAPASATTTVVDFATPNPITLGVDGTFSDETTRVAGAIYDFAFTLAGGTGTDSQLQATVISSGITTPFTFDLYGGTCTSGAHAKCTATTGVLGVGTGNTAGLTANLAGGSYYLQIVGSLPKGNLVSGGVGTTPIPEPATWAMMLLGFGALGGIVRTSRKRPLATV